MKKNYRLSTSISVIGKRLLNTFTGDLYELTRAGQRIVGELAHGEVKENNSLFRRMFDEGIIVCPDEDTQKERFHLQWHLLNDCNLRCRHCYDEKRGCNPLTFEQMLAVADNLVLFLKKCEFNGEVSLTGGEPLLFPKLLELIKYLKSRDVFIAPFILTNGTLPFSKDLIGGLLDFNVGVQISIDGNQKVHDEIRGGGTYYRSVSTIKQLISAGISPAIHYVIMKRNSEVIEEFLIEMLKLGIKRVNFSSLVQVGPGAQESALSPEENMAVIAKVAALQEKYPAISVLARRPLWYSVGSSGLCPVGIKTLTIDANGMYMPCRRLPIILGNSRTDTFFKVWFTSEFLQKMRQREKFLKVCGKCPKADVCGGCRAIAYAVYGDAFAPDPSCHLTQKVG